MSSLSQNMAYTSEAQDHRFRLGNTEALHTNALNQLGIKSVRRDRGKKLGKRGKGKRKTSAKVHVSRKPSMLLHKQEKEVHLIQLRKEAGQRLLGLVHRQKAMDNLTDLFQGREEVEKKLEEEKLDSKIRLAKRLKKRNRKSLQFADLHIDLLKQIHTDTPEIVIANAIQNFREKMRNSDLIENAKSIDPRKKMDKFGTLKMLESQQVPVLYHEIILTDLGFNDSDDTVSFRDFLHWIYIDHEFVSSKAKNAVRIIMKRTKSRLPSPFAEDNKIETSVTQAPKVTKVDIKKEIVTEITTALSLPKENKIKQVKKQETVQTKKIVTEITKALSLPKEIKIKQVKKLEIVQKKEIVTEIQNIKPVKKQEIELIQGPKVTKVETIQKREITKSSALSKEIELKPVKKQEIDLIQGPKASKVTKVETRQKKDITKTSALPKTIDTKKKSTTTTKKEITKSIPIVAEHAKLSPLPDANRKIIQFFRKQFASSTLLAQVQKQDIRKELPISGIIQILQACKLSTSDQKIILIDLGLTTKTSHITCEKFLSWCAIGTSNNNSVAVAQKDANVVGTTSQNTKYNMQDPEITEIKKIILDLVKTPTKMQSIFQRLDREHSHGLTSGEFYLFVSSACKKVGKKLDDRIFKLLWSCIEHHKVNDHDELEEIAIEKWLFTEVTADRMVIENFRKVFVSSTLFTQVQKQDIRKELPISGIIQILQACKLSTSDQKIILIDLGLTTKTSHITCGKFLSWCAIGNSSIPTKTTDKVAVTKIEMKKVVTASVPVHVKQVKQVKQGKQVTKKQGKQVKQVKEKTTTSAKGKQVKQDIQVKQVKEKTTTSAKDLLVFEKFRKAFLSSVLLGQIQSIKPENKITLKIVTRLLDACKMNKKEQKIILKSLNFTKKRNYIRCKKFLLWCGVR